MKYALLAYSRTTRDRAPIEPPLAEILARPTVKSWMRLRPAESATTLTRAAGRTLLTDGPFIESKEYLSGLIIIEAAHLDEALALATELQNVQGAPAIEVRPIHEDG